MQQHNLETEKLRPRSLVMAICIPVVLVVLVTGALVTLYMSKPAPTRLQATCVSQTCSQYDALVIDLLNTTVDPCEDFYAHVCGAWTSDPTKLSVSKTALIAYRQSLSRLALRQPVPPLGQTLQEKAAKLFTACYNIVETNSSNVDSIRRVMKEAGIPWPHIDSTTDLLHSVFSMAAWSVPVPFWIAFTDAGNQTGHLVIASITLGVFSNHIWKKKDEGRRERYFSVLKHYFKDTEFEKDISYNETLSLEHRIIPTLQMSLVKEIEIARTHTNELHKMAPSVPPKAWQRELSVRFNVSAASVTIYGAEFFKTFFDLHRTLGEDALKSYFGWFVIESFLPYTNAHILREFHGTMENAREEQTNSCLRLASLAGYALYANYLNNTADARMFDQVTEVGERIKNVFFDTLKRNSWFEESLSTLEIGRAVVWRDLLGQSSEEEKLPDMSDDALENLAALSSLRRRWLMSATLKDAPSVHAMLMAMHLPGEDSHVWDASTSPTLTLKPYHFAFPFFAADAPVPALYAGIGFVLVRLLFHQLFAGRQRWKIETLDELVERTACIYSGDEAALMDRGNRDDVVASTAAVSTAWRAFMTATAPASNSTGEAKGADLQVPTLNDRRLFYVLLCHSRCGDNAGPLLCNLPFRNSEAFVETFSCRPGSPMHAARMCPVFQ